MYTNMEVLKEVQAIYNISTRCPICNAKCKSAKNNTIYCTIHGYMDRVNKGIKSKEVKH